MSENSTHRDAFDFIVRYVKNRWGNVKLRRRCRKERGLEELWFGSAQASDATRRYTLVRDNETMQWNVHEFIRRVQPTRNDASAPTNHKPHSQDAKNTDTNSPTERKRPYRLTKCKADPRMVKVGESFLVKDSEDCAAALEDLIHRRTILEENERAFAEKRKQFEEKRKQFEEKLDRFEQEKKRLKKLEHNLEVMQKQLNEKEMRLHTEEEEPDTSMRGSVIEAILALKRAST